MEEIFQTLRDQTPKVFESKGIKHDFSLKSLEQIDQYIKKHYYMPVIDPHTLVELSPYAIYFGDTLTKLFDGAKWLMGESTEDTYIFYKGIAVRPFHTIAHIVMRLDDSSSTVETTKLFNKLTGGD